MKPVNIILFIFSFYYFIDNSFCQTPVILWQKSFGGSGYYDEAQSVCKTSDGGNAVFGFTSSTDGDVTDLHLNQTSSDNFWLIKLDPFGNVEWNKCYGGIWGNEDGSSIQQTFDGGFIMAGFTDSNDGDVSGLHGGGPFGGYDDYWVVKTDSSGTIQWQKCFGGSATDDATEISVTSDSGYIVTGITESADGDVAGGHFQDVLTVKMDQYGVKQWAKTMGGNNYENGNSCKQTIDGGYLIAGTTFSTDGDLTGIPAHGLPDVWVVKLNASAQISWQKCYGGSGGDYGSEIILSTNGNFFISASTSSNDGDVSGNNGADDYWLIKADSSGNILWQKCFGGAWGEAELTAAATSDGGVVINGNAERDDGVVSGIHGLWDYWVVKVDSSGNYQWSKVLGGSGQDYGYAVCETQDSGYLAAGYTESSDGDITFNHGGRDFWVVKLGPLGLTTSEIPKPLMDLTISQTNDQLNLRFFSKINEHATFGVYDITGKKIIEKENYITEGINYCQINCSGLANGIYFLDVEGKDCTQREKFALIEN